MLFSSTAKSNDGNNLDINKILKWFLIFHQLEKHVTAA
jgi:hypothetical protein